MSKWHFCLSPSNHKKCSTYKPAPKSKQKRPPQPDKDQAPTSPYSDSDSDSDCQIEKIEVSSTEDPTKLLPQADCNPIKIATRWQS